MGLTADGFEVESFEDKLARIEARLRVTMGAPNLDVRDPEGFIASLVLPLVEEFVGLEELLQIIFYAIDKNRSTRQSFAAVASLRGVDRKPAEIGTHPGVSMAFDAAVVGSVDRGAIRFHPQGQAENVWINSEDLAIGGAGSYSIAVESEIAGSDKVLLEDATIEIVGGPSQLTGITVPSNATAGTDLEAEAVWRERAEQAFTTTRTPLQRKLEDDVPGVIAATVIERPGYVHVIVNDGGLVDDDVIAEAILEAKAQGAVTQGDIIASAGGVQVRFSRDTQTQLYAAITVKAPLGISETDLKAALIAEVPTTPGATLIWGRVYAAAFEVRNVEDVIDLKISTKNPPLTSENITISGVSRFVLSAGNITVTVLP